MPIDNIVWDEPKDIVWDEPTQKNEFRKPLNLRENNAVDKFMSAIPNRGVMDVLDTIATQGYGRLTGNKEIIGAEAERQAKEWEAQNPDIASKAGRIVGNIAATAPLAPSMGMGAAAANLPRVASALRTGGMTTGIVPKGVIQGAGDLALRAGAAGAGGVAAGGLINPDEITKSGIYSAALPIGLKGFGLLGQGVGKVADAVSNTSAGRTALKKVAETIGDNPSQAIEQMRGYKGEIPLTASAITQNPQLAALEVGNRVRNPANWYPFEQEQGRALFNKVLSSTKDAEDLATRAATRQNNWQSNWANVENSVNPQVFSAKIPEFQKNIDIALKSPESVNPAVRGMLESIKSEIDRVGEGFSPAHLQQIRANLSGKYNPMSPNAFQSAPRDSKATKDVLKQVDSILNESTGGVWDKVPAGYKADSDLLHQAKAASKIRGSYIDADTGRILPKATIDATGDIPSITEAGLGRAMNAARMPQTKNLLLSQEANQGLEEALNAIRRQNITKNVKSAGSLGGSDTAVNMGLSAAPSGMSKSIIRDLIKGVSEAGTAKVDKQLAGLLADPQATSLLLSDLLAKQNPSMRNQFINYLPYGAMPALSAQ